jgi:predicted DCC family thiol-disulfide oxidoreductase YuxK
MSGYEILMINFGTDKARQAVMKSDMIFEIVTAVNIDIRIFEFVTPSLL